VCADTEADVSMLTDTVGVSAMIAFAGAGETGGYLGGLGGEGGGINEARST
jgi:hypothetical protein